MSDSQKITKLGTSASEIRLVNNVFIKTHKSNKISELNAIKKGINIISKNLPYTIECPEFIEIQKSVDINEEFHLTYNQKKLHPWIKADWITGQQLYQVGETILKQQSLLFNEDLCLIDARPENYWLAKTKGVLVDLGSIKPLNRQNLLSFETDFQKHFITPLILEIELNLPVSSYFKGQLQSSNINLWGLNRNLRSITSIKDLIKNSFVDFISNIISSSSPEFIDFLNFESSAQKNENFKNKNKKKIINNLERKFKKLIPYKINQSNWNNYSEFHSKEYTQKKIDQIKKFVDSRKNFTKIVDLGSNLTTKSVKNINLRIDNDLITCRKMRQTYDDKQIILLIDIAEYLCHFDKDKDKDNPLNCSGEAKAAVIVGLIHHLIIDYGLNINIFYENISRLYDHVLLEFPSVEDPMVKLLMRKRNEFIPWDWQNDHLPSCTKYFNVIEYFNLNDTRIIFKLQKKKISR